jgi:nitrate reductase (cytochrome), electron transfer subunit
MLYYRLFAIVLILSFTLGCNKGKKKELIDEDELRIIDANVKSEETNLKSMAKYNDATPGTSERIDRAFENAPPLIPHTTEGFFPITIQNNICLSCHMPDKVATSGAVQIPATHFTTLRPKMVEVNGVLQFEKESGVHIQELDSLNSAYYNCSQCHVPQTNVTVNIENLFTPEFREEHGLEKSSLKEKLKEGL